MPKKMKRIYKPVEGSRIPKTKAQSYGEELERLKKVNDGFLDAEIVLESAKRKKSPLHSHFEWNDTEAARKYRLEQARYMIRSIEVEIITSEGDRRSERAFLNIQVSPVEKGEIPVHKYTDIQTIAKNPYYKNQVIQNALREAREWSKRYEDYNELDGIRYAIRKAVKNFNSA